MIRKIILAISLLLATDIATAQNQLGESPLDVAQRNSRLLKTELGMVPRTLEDLVASSPIIVRGIYGKLLDNRLDLGEGRTIEQLAQQLDLPLETIEGIGIPISSHQFNVSEVIKDSGLLDERDPFLEVEFAEDPNAYDIFPWLREFREGEHLLFVDVASTGDFYLRGQIFDMKLINGRYIFRYGPNAEESIAFGSEEAPNFLREIRRLAEQE